MVSVTAIQHRNRRRTLGRNRWRYGWLDRPDQTEPAVPALVDVHGETKPLQRLGIAAAAEATTLLLLVAVAFPLKHLSDWPAAVQVLGPIHGLAFVAYLWLVLQSLGAGLLSRGAAARLALSALVPVAGYLAARSLGRRTAGQPSRGQWR
jgi:integral membrane protein